VPIKEDSLKELRNALDKAKKDGFEIELLTAVTPPAGRPPNITGVVQKVNKGTVELLLTRGPQNRIGIYSISQLTGFVPASGDEENDA
jgi:hypothetical protein